MDFLDNNYCKCNECNICNTNSCVLHTSNFTGLRGATDKIFLESVESEDNHIN